MSSLLYSSFPVAKLTPLVLSNPSVSPPQVYPPHLQQVSSLFKRIVQKINACSPYFRVLMVAMLPVHLYEVVRQVTRIVRAMLQPGASMAKQAKIRDAQFCCYQALATLGQSIFDIFVCGYELGWFGSTRANARAWVPPLVITNACLYFVSLPGRGYVIARCQFLLRELSHAKYSATADRAINALQTPQHVNERKRFQIHASRLLALHREQLQSMSIIEPEQYRELQKGRVMSAESIEGVTEKIRLVKQQTAVLLAAEVIYTVALIFLALSLFFSHTWLLPASLACNTLSALFATGLWMWKFAQAFPWHGWKETLIQQIERIGRVVKQFFRQLVEELQRREKLLSGSL